MPNIVTTLSGWKNCSKDLISPQSQIEEVRLKKLKLHAKDLIFNLERRLAVPA